MTIKVFTQTVGKKDPKTKFTVTVDGQDFTRTTKSLYTHALLITMSDRRFMTFHKSKANAEQAKGQYELGTGFSIIELTPEVAEEVTFEKTGSTTWKASNGLYIYKRVFPSETFFIKTGSGEKLEEFSTLNQAKKYLKEI